ncbi:hypothetical protein PC116_g26232 [Phytophthora cactorum]|nr:hypothetical protein C6341_g26552 [Phytophthora cactorum]KAG3132467.1 hypothetical protein PC128_g26470 [Phytophthora cactorum]KAG4225331.1 hypothetical protein PC116_g26232 [Phytophthora cactorum]
MFRLRAKCGWLAFYAALPNSTEGLVTLPQEVAERANDLKNRS